MEQILIDGDGDLAIIVHDAESVSGYGVFYFSNADGNPRYCSLDDVELYLDEAPTKYRKITNDNDEERRKICKAITETLKEYLKKGVSL